LIDSIRCVVFNSSYEFLSVVSVRKAIKLIVKGKAQAISNHPTEVFSNGWPVPVQVRLNYYVRTRQIQKKPSILNNTNLFVRDNYTCQYCGRTKSELKEHEFLTRDHVIPRARGGTDAWTNVVTSCNKCNHKKDNKTLAEAGMKPMRTPVVPSIFEIWMRKTLKTLPTPDISL